MQLCLCFLWYFVCPGAGAHFGRLRICKYHEKKKKLSSQHAKQCQRMYFSPNVQIKCKSYPTLHHFLKHCERFTSCSPGHLHFFLGLGGTIRMKSGSYIFYGGRLYHQSKTLVFALFQGFLLPITLSTASPNVSSLLSDPSPIIGYACH